MKNLITNNLGMKILSVLIAVLIWLLVVNTNDPVVTKRFSNIPVEIINEDVLTKEGYAYEILEGDSVYISVKGKNSILGSMSDDDFVAYADFSKLSVVDAVPIDVEAKRYQAQLEINLGNTNTMKIKRDEIVDVNVPVNIVAKGKVADGYAIGKMSGTPNLVKVSGPKNLLSNAKEIRAEIELNGISSDTTTTAKPLLYDEKGELIDSSQLDMDTSGVYIDIKIWKTKKVDVHVDYEGEVADGYVISSFDYEPKQITVAAPDEVLEDLEQIELPAISLNNETKDCEKDYELTTDLLPSKVILADTNTSVKAQATIEPLLTRRFAVTQDDLTVKNNKGYKVTMAPGTICSFTVECAKSVAKELSVEDFDPWIDIEGIEEGTHNMNLHLNNVKGVTIKNKTEANIVLEN